MYQLPNSLFPKQLEEFKQIYSQQYGEEITNEKAQKLGLELIDFIVHILLIRG